MNKLNKSIFDEYSSNDYFKSNDEGEKKFKALLKFPNAVGFNHRSYGFIVLHKSHKSGGIEDEIPACLILKNLGFGVELIEEHDHHMSMDVKIEGTNFEVKRLHNCDDWASGILRHFRRAYKKTTHLILHIDQRMHAHNLRRAIRNASNTYGSIQVVWLIFQKRLTQLTKEAIQKAEYNL
jgi:hypothetical protein